ncbi:hypothetical protein GGE65_004923 [Skermanella aerolata]
MENNMIQSHTRRDSLRQPRDVYQEVALKRSHYDAAHWQAMADDYRNKMCNLHISDSLRNYYENEAHLCEAEAKKNGSR